MVFADTLDSVDEVIESTFSFSVYFPDLWTKQKVFNFNHNVDMEKTNRKHAFISDIRISHLHDKDIVLDLTSNEKIQKEIELQLHEQYAQNNNSYFGSIVILLCTLFAVFYAFGYVYLHSVFVSSMNYETLVINDKEYTFEALLLTSFATLIVIAICYCVCAYQGIAQRKEQFIIDAIRSKYYGENHNEAYKLFPQKYNPRDKKEHEIFQGHYGLYMKIMYWVAGFIIVMTVLRPFVSSSSQKNEGLLVEVIIFLIAIFALAWFCRRFYKQQKKKYEDIEKEYSDDKDKRLAKKQKEEYEKTSKELNEIKEVILSSFLRYYCQKIN